MTDWIVPPASQLLTDVLEHCLQHPYDGKPLDVGVINFQQRYDHATGIKTVSVMGDPPEIMAFSVELLRDIDPRFATFEDGLLSIRAEPQRLLYEPLYVGQDALSVVFRRAQPASDGSDCD